MVKKAITSILSSSDTVISKTGRTIIDGSKKAETVLRKVSGLGVKPDPVGLHFTPTENSDLYTMTVDDEDTVMKSREDYHNEPFKAKLIGKVCTKVHHFGYELYSEGIYLAPNKFREIIDNIKGPLVYRELSKARILQIESPYIHNIGRKDDICEVYIELPSGSLWFQISSASSYQMMAKFELEGKDILYRDSETMWNTEIIVPTESITPAIVETAMKLWYIQNFEWVQGHWSMKEKKLPFFNINLEWDTDVSSEEKLRATIDEKRVLDLLMVYSRRNVLPLFGSQVYSSLK